MPTTTESPPRPPKPAPLVHQWVRIGVAPEPVLMGRAGSNWPTVRGSALYRERSALLRIGAAPDSPLSALGAEVFQRIARLVAGANPDDHTDALSARQLRLLLPLALACRAHYALVRALAHALYITAPRKSGRLLELDVLAHALLSYPNLRILQLIGPLSTPSRATLLLSRLAVSLTELRLHLCHGLTAASFRSLRACRRLRLVHVAACGDLSPELADELSALPALRDVRIYGCAGTSDAFFTRLLQAPALESLDINGGMRFTNDTLHAIQQSPSARTLRRLVLSPCTMVSDHAVAAVLARTCALVELQLERAWRISYLVVCWAADRVPLLEKLCLRRCGSYVWYDATEIGALPRLRHLEVSGDAFNDAQLSIFVAGCRALRVVVIGQCQGVSDDGVRDVCTLPGLQVLQLAHCSGVTDEIVTCIAAAVNKPLREVRLTACNFVSEQACRSLEQCCVSVWHPFLPRICEVNRVATPDLLAELSG